jgi:hypothetical protein
VKSIREGRGVPRPYKKSTSPTGARAMPASDGKTKKDLSKAGIAEVTYSY